MYIFFLNLFLDEFQQKYTKISRLHLCRTLHLLCLQIFNIILRIPGRRRNFCCETFHLKLRQYVKLDSNLADFNP